MKCRTIFPKQDGEARCEIQLINGTITVPNVVRMMLPENIGGRP